MSYQIFIPNKLDFFSGPKLLCKPHHGQSATLSWWWGFALMTRKISEIWRVGAN